MKLILVVFISGGMVENSQNGVSRSLNVYSDLDGPSFFSHITRICCSNQLLGCYCHPDQLIQLVRVIIQANLR